MGLVRAVKISTSTNRNENVNLKKHSTHEIKSTGVCFSLVRRSLLKQDNIGTNNEYDHRRFSFFLTDERYQLYLLFYSNRIKYVVKYLLSTQ